MKKIFVLLIICLPLFCSCYSDPSEYDKYYDDGYSIGYEHGIEVGMQKHFDQVSEELSSYSPNDFCSLAKQYGEVLLYTEEQLFEIINDALHYGYLVGYGDRALGNDCYYSTTLLDYYPEYETYFDHNMDDIKNVISD